MSKDPESMPARAVQLQMLRIRMVPSYFKVVAAVAAPVALVQRTALFFSPQRSCRRLIFKGVI